jgi:hypothetical protein
VARCTVATGRREGWTGDDLTVVRGGGGAPVSGGGLRADLKHGEEMWELRTDGIEGRWPVEGTHQGGRYAVRLEEERGAKGKPKAGGD